MGMSAKDRLGYKRIFLAAVQGKPLSKALSGVLTKEIVTTWPGLEGLLNEAEMVGHWEGQKSLIESLANGTYPSGDFRGLSVALVRLNATLSDAANEDIADSDPKP